MTRGNLSWICFKFFVGKEWVVLHKKFVQKCVFIYHILSYTDPIFEKSLEKQQIKKCSPNAMHIFKFFPLQREITLINGKCIGVFKGKKNFFAKRPWSNKWHSPFLNEGHTLFKITSNFCTWQDLFSSTTF